MATSKIKFIDLVWLSVNILSLALSIWNTLETLAQAQISWPSFLGGIGLGILIGTVSYMWKRKTNNESAWGGFELLAIATFLLSLFRDTFADKSVPIMWFVYSSAHLRTRILEIRRPAQANASGEPRNSP